MLAWRCLTGTSSFLAAAPIDLDNVFMYSVWLFPLRLVVRQLTGGGRHVGIAETFYHSFDTDDAT